MHIHPQTIIKNDNYFSIIFQEKIPVSFANKTPDLFRGNILVQLATAMFKL